MKSPAFAVLLTATFASAIVADTIPYPNIGGVAPANTFTAAATGEIFAYFYGSSADDPDIVTLLVNGVQTGPGVPNHGLSIGAPFDLGAVTAGDALVFDLYDEFLGVTLSSDPAESADGLSHVYAATFSGGGGIPAGTYLGFEDEPLAFSDFDYNDSELVVTNVAFQTIPEPDSIWLLAGGVAMLVWSRRQKREIRSKKSEVRSKESEG